MPWSPVPKFPEIIQDLKRNGYTKEVTFEILRVSIMRITGIIKSNTIKQTIKAMEALGYLKMNGTVWLVCKNKPYDFLETEEEKKEEEKIDDLIGEKK